MGGAIVLLSESNSFTCNYTEFSLGLKQHCHTYHSVVFLFLSNHRNQIELQLEFSDRIKHGSRMDIYIFVIVNLILNNLSIGATCFAGQCRCCCGIVFYYIRMDLQSQVPSDQGQIIKANCIQEGIKAQDISLLS